MALGMAVWAQKAVELADEPDYHLLTDNDFARVFLVEIPARSATQLHRHEHDYLSISLNDSTVYAARAGEMAVMVSHNKGDVQFVFKGFAHVTRNESGQTFRCIEVELVKPSDNLATFNVAQTYPNKTMPPPTDPNASYSTILDRDTFKAQQMQLLAGNALPVSTSEHEILLIALNDLQISDERADGPQALELHAGEVMWLPAGPARKLKNTARQNAQLVLVQFR